jgi:hypothetical protein
MVGCNVMLATIRERDVETNLSFQNEINLIALITRCEQLLSRRERTPLHASLEIRECVVFPISEDIEIAQGDALIGTRKQPCLSQPPLLNKLQRIIELIKYLNTHLFLENACVVEVPPEILSTRKLAGQVAKNQLVSAVGQPVSYTLEDMDGAKVH